MKQIEIEKFGVECGCPKGEPDETHLVKTASGERRCDVCGRVYPAPQEQPKSA